MSYQLPREDVEFILSNLVQLDSVAQLPVFADYELNLETSMAIIDEAGKIASNSLAPCNRIGDEQGAKLVDGVVTLPAEFGPAYQTLAEGGWAGVSLPTEVGGQGLPELFNTIAMENWVGANMALSLNLLLGIGASMAINAHGSEQQKNLYLPKMASGVWSGAMDLTEPQAGSDLSAVKTTATPDGDHYRIRGQKIFISWGEHELTENIIHLVLARLPGAPAGTRGISLFIVPKFLTDDAGNIGERNDVQCLSLEEKMGIHASPTCVMSFGDNDGAIGYLIGPENQGLACMFTMMNEARLKVGVQGLGVAEAAYQKALAFSHERAQAGAIFKHPDVKRMLMTQKSLVEAMRAIAYVEAIRLDVGHHQQDDQQIAQTNLMIPIIKSWFTEIAQEVTSLGMQVHGGMGFVEETGAAQFCRDIRITPIYEGTNGIQAADLVLRKVVADGGDAMAHLTTEIAADIASVEAHYPAEAKLVGAALAQMRAATQSILDSHADAGRNTPLANSHDFLMLCGYVCGGWQMLRAMPVCGDDQFGQQKLTTARFYINRILPRREAHAGVFAANADDWLNLAI